MRENREVALQWKDKGQQPQVAREIYSDFFFPFIQLESSWSLERSQGELVDSPSLEIFNTWLDKALSNAIKLGSEPWLEQEVALHELIILAMLWKTIFTQQEQVESK